VLAHDLSHPHTATGATGDVLLMVVGGLLEIVLQVVDPRGVLVVAVGEGLDDVFELRLS